MRIPTRGGSFDRVALDKHVDAMSDLATGATNSGGDLTLAAGATSTTVADPLCAENAMVMLSPTSASAATAQVWVASVSNGQFTVGHDAAPATDRTFHYEIRRR